jgi:hypothetical protein
MRNAELGTEVGRSIHLDVENPKNPDGIAVHSIVDDMLTDMLRSQARLKIAAVFSYVRMNGQPLKCTVQLTRIDQPLLVSPDLSCISQRGTKIAIGVWS